ncbi:transcription termination factor 4, mitochondrial [Sardina pilchardus]|uniref:transcription termination factor 4, mitochondrial n=1 Tax=Sardina pilchardus TaxID=27697 RepID=UPI002E0F8CDB
MFRPETFCRRTNMIRTCGHQVVRWSLRLSPGFALKSATLVEQNARQLAYSCRMCSHTQESQTSRASAQRHGSELSLRTLLDMGFTDTQAELVYEGAIKTLGKRSVTHDTSTITALFALGLNSSSIVKIFDKCPVLYTVRGAVVQQRIQNLWKLGVVDGTIQRVISYYPHILLMPAKRVNAAVEFIRTKCLFTAQQMRDILRDTPEVVEEDLNELEHKFQYAYFRMGVKQAEMVKAKLFKVSMEELRCRHCFLERRGFYQTPDKKGQTLIINPKLKDILSATEDVYLAQFAKATKEELDVFRKLVTREDEEKSNMPENWDIEEDEEETEEDMTDFKRGNMGHLGYVKSRRKR